MGSLATDGFKLLNRGARFLFVGAHGLIVLIGGGELLQSLALSHARPTSYAAPPPAPSPDWVAIFQVSLLVSWGLALVYSVIVPLIRQRLDLVSIAGAMYIAAGIIVEAVLPDGLRVIDTDPIRYYVLPIAVPSLLVAMVLHRTLPRRFAPGLCQGCGYDRRGLSAEAVCPECGVPGTT